MQLGLNPVAVVSTHLHTNNTQNNTINRTQHIHNNKKYKHTIRIHKHNNEDT